MQARAFLFYWPLDAVKWCRNLLLLALLFFPILSLAESIRVAIAAEDYPPFYYQTEQGDMDGFSVQVLQAIAKQLDSRLVWHRYPWKRMIHHVQDGRADLIMVIYKTDVRAEQFIFSEVSYLRDSIVLLCHQPCPVHYDGDLKTLEVKEVAVVRGFSYGKVLDELPLVPVSKVTSEDMLFKLLDNGRLQLGVASYLTVKHSAVFKQPQVKVDVLTPSLAEVDIYFAFSRQGQLTAKQIVEFNLALRRFVRSPEYRALLHTYQME